MNRRKIVTIGAGIAGLCAGVYARRCGYDAVILEKHSMAGGLATSWHRDGYTFETCLHWLLGSGNGGALNAQWKEVFDIGALTFVDPAEYARIEGPHGETLTLYTDTARMEAELLKQAPQDAEQIRHLASAVRRLAKVELPDPAEHWPHNWLSLLRMLPELPVLNEFNRISMREYGARFSHPLLRALLSGGGTGNLAALAFVFSLAWMSRKNAAYPIGGSQAIIRAIAARFAALGGELRLNADVERIVVENDRATGVTLKDGETIGADWVISAADGHATIYGLLAGRYTDSRIDRIYQTMEPFPSYLQVSLGVARDLSREPGYLVRLLEKPFALDPATLLPQVSFRFFHFDPTFAPVGKTAVTSFLPTRNHEFWVDLATNDPKGYAAEKQRVADAVIAILETRMPGIRADIETSDVSTPASIIRFTGNWKGSMEGWVMAPGMDFKPLFATLPGLSGFRMVGQWVMPGGGLPSGLMSARATLQGICEHDGVSFLAGMEAVEA